MASADFEGFLASRNGTVFIAETKSLGSGTNTSADAYAAVDHAFKSGYITGQNPKVSFSAFPTTSIVDLVTMKLQKKDGPWYSGSAHVQALKDYINANF